MNRSSFFSSLLIFIGFSTSAFSQSTANASAGVTIVNPISISKNSDMAFGNIAVQGGTGGTVILDPSGSRSATSGVTFPASEGNVRAASFTVTGASSFVFDITLPTSVTLIQLSGSETMTANSFRSSPSTTGALTSGTQAIQIGATLTVAPNQQPGMYTSAGFDVTVTYN